MINFKISYNNIVFTLSDLETFEEREMHSYNDILFLMKGNLPIYTRDFQRNVHDDTVLIIPKESFHFFKLKKGSPFIRLKIAFHDSEGIIHSFGKSVKIIDSLDKKTSFLLNEITEILQKEPSEKEKMKIYGAFLMLVSELSDRCRNFNIEKRSEENLISKCIHYIDNNIDKKLTMESVAKELFVSPSTLSHSFKEEIGVTFHRYLSEKRLVSIQRKISQGNAPTKVFKDFGYSDYSSFYRAYKKLFGYPPSY